MIEEQARVVRVAERVAEVITQRHSSCARCEVKSGCGTSLLAAWFPQRQLTFQLRDDIGVAPGDRVVIGLDEGLLQRGSLLLYAWPLVGLLGGAILGDRLFGYFGGFSEPGAALFGLLGLIGALTLVRQVSRRQLANGDAGVRLLRVVDRSADFPLADLAMTDGSSSDSVRNLE